MTKINIHILDSDQPASPPPTSMFINFLIKVKKLPLKQPLIENCHI